MKIAVFGSGGVGGYFGGRLAAAGEDVAFVARGDHLAAMQRDGLFIESPNGNVRISPVAATDSPESIGHVDAVLFSVKLYDLDRAASMLAPLIGPGTFVLTLQNGLDAPAMLSRYVERGHIVAGAAYVVAAIDAPGRIRHTTAGRLVFGEADGSRSARLTALESACHRAGLEARLSEAIDVELWTKFARLATWSGMTAVTRSPMGVIRESTALAAMMESALTEATAVGRARGILFAESFEEATRAMVLAFPPSSKSSMLEDLERGRRLELPWLSGAVARMGAETGVPTPIHGFITTVLDPFVNGGSPYR